MGTEPPGAPAPGEAGSLAQALTKEAEQIGVECAGRVSLLQPVFQGRSPLLPGQRRGQVEGSGVNPRLMLGESRG